jgi:hypothetical protein
MKAHLAQASEKMCRNLTRRSRFDASLTKLICESSTHEIVIGQCSKLDPRRYEIFEDLYWRVTPIRERGMKMEVGFHKEKIMR